ncbi:MAG: hypothetical protein GY754_03575 [bacterium]|nr:hypothetical protein [bacterium]
MKTKKPVISKKILFRIKPDEIIFDLFLVIYSEFILYSVIPGDMKLYQLFTMNWLVFMGIAITFFITWYAGLLAAGFAHRVKKKFLTIPYMLLLLWIPASMFLFIAWNLEELSVDGLNKGQLYWSFFGGLLGLISGLIFAYTEQQVERGKSVLQTRVQAMTGPLGLIFIYTGFSPLVDKLMILFFIMGFIIFFAGIKIGSMLEDKNYDERPISRSYTIFRTWIFPVIIVMIICLWEELYIWGKIEGALMNNKTLSVKEMLGYLTVSGIIPLRIMMILRPPFTLFGLLTGAATMGYFIYCITVLIKSV